MNVREFTDADQGDSRIRSLEHDLAEARGCLAILLGNHDNDDPDLRRWAVAWSIARKILAKEPGA